MTKIKQGDLQGWLFCVKDMDAIDNIINRLYLFADMTVLFEEEAGEYCKQTPYEFGRLILEVADRLKGIVLPNEVNTER